MGFSIDCAHCYTDEQLRTKIKKLKKDMLPTDQLSISALDSLLRFNYPVKAPYVWRTLYELQEFCESQGFETVFAGVDEPRISYKWVGKLTLIFKGLKV